MGRSFIVQGDTTDRNGIVMDGISGSSLDGKPLAYIGGVVKCHSCDKEGVIIADGAPHTVSEWASKSLWKMTSANAHATHSPSSLHLKHVAR